MEESASATVKGGGGKGGWKRTAEEGDMLCIKAVDTASLVYLVNALLTIICR